MTEARNTYRTGADENGHFGLVAITDRPWQGFVEAVRKANLKAPAALLPKTAPAKAAEPAKP